MPANKIIVDFQKLSNLNSGLGQFCLHLGRSMAKNNNRQFELFFVVPEGMKGIFGEEVKYLYSFEARKNSMEFDLLHLAHQEASIDCIAKRKLFTIHDLNFLYKYKGLKRMMKSFFLRKRVESADGLVFISKFSQTEFFGQYPKIKKNSCVIYNGLPNPVASSRPSGKLGDRPFFLSLGIVAAKKNIHVLIPMMRYFPDFDLIVAGNHQSTYAQGLLREVRKKNLDHQIVFTGEISDEEKSWYLENCQALLFPSLSEGFGLPVIEAFHFGKPVFCSALTSLPEIGGDIAFYWDSFDSPSMANTIKEAIKKWTEADSIAAIERSKIFNWDNSARLYFKYYQEILMMGRGNSPAELSR